MRRNSSTPSCAFWTTADSVSTAMPSATGIVHDVVSIVPRGVSTSTRHMRHMPTGFIRGCQQNRGM